MGKETQAFLAGVLTGILLLSVAFLVATKPEIKMYVDEMDCTRVGERVVCIEVIPPTVDS
jgi:hypothetical protein